MRAIPVTATGTVYTGHGELTLHAVELTAAAAAATLIVREVDGAGAILASVAAPIGTSVSFETPRQFRTALHCTITGAGAHATVLV